MKKLFWLATLVFFTSSTSLAIEGGDGAPWPFDWGSECPFPWNQIEGAWKVQGTLKSPHSGDILEFTLDEDVSSGHLLIVEHFDKEGQIVGRGTGYSDKTNRVTKAIMTGLNKKEGQRYRLLVRSYAALKATTGCFSKAQKVMAVTFCPLRGKKCLETANYTLKR